MNDTAPQYVNLWSVHSEKDGRPAICAWAHTEQEANERMQELEQSDTEPGTSYWVMQMTESEVAAFKASGFIPADA